MTFRKVLQALSLTFFVFGLLGWLYIVLNSAVHPQTLGMQLTHFTKWPHEDTSGEISFVISLLSFFVYQLVKPDRGSKR